MPNRVLKESICYSGDIDKLTPFEETVFYRIIVRADDYGNLDGRMDFLKSVLFTTKPSVGVKKIQSACEKLEEVGLVLFYEVDGKPYLHITNWDKHQRMRKTHGKYPRFAATCGNLPPETETDNETETETDTDTELFKRFWRVFPKKTGRREAMEWFVREKPSEDLVERMCHAVDVQKESEAWRRENGRYIPKAINWLSDSRWEDTAEEVCYGATV